MTTQTSAGSAGGGRAVPGTIIGGRYQLRAAIGKGGMGTVWQALDIVLRRDVAVKEVILPRAMPPGEREAIHERTMREARAAAALSHPSVVQVYDVVTEEDRPWIVMELLQARSLSEIIISDGPLSGRAVCKIGIALLGALEVAHAASVLHRDVKPANVLICADGRCVLTDFGVARMPSESNLTQPGMVLGSPHFISPERAIGAKFGPPSDLFSLGVTLYTAIEGRPPFDRGDPFETMRAIVEEEPLPPVRAGALALVLAGLLDKDPERRWTVNRARNSLRELMSPPARQRAPGASVAPAPPAQRRPTPGPAAIPAQIAYDRPAASMGMAAAARPSRARDVGAALGAISARLVERVRAWPRRVQVAAAAAGGAVLLVAVLIAALSGGAPTATKVSVSKPTSSAKATKPPFAVQTFTDPRGMSVNVPASWKEQSTSSYTNFVDPKDSKQRMRLNVESSGKASAMQFLTGAERNLKNKICDSYTRVGLTDIQLDGKPAAQLEYTCGSSQDLRHGIWAAVTSGGKAYHFYLTVPDANYEADLPIFNEMVASFRLSA